MKVKKSLNNSMLLAENDGKEMILFGKGIGFNTKPGTIIDLQSVEQVFIYPQVATLSVTNGHNSRGFL